jgi:hypothetical protein
MLPDFMENFKHAESLVACVHTQDLYVFPGRTTLHPLWPHLPWVTYMNLWD